MQTIKYYHNTVPINNNKLVQQHVTVVFDDMFKLVKELRKNNPNAKILFHNFANDFKPCAGSWKGNTQEEQLFQRTRIQESLTKDLYPISPGIILTKNLEFEGIYFDLASIAAIDCPSTVKVISRDMSKDGLRYEDYQLESEVNETYSRIELLFKLAGNYDIFITGAWGCGIFYNPYYGICKLFNKMLENTKIPQVIFCTYGKKEFEHFKSFINQT